MMEDIFTRTRLILGAAAMERLQNARVAVFGLGGVGGYVVEALARSGVGALDLIDNDTVSATNINRQIIALHSTVGQKKTDAAKARVLDINPACVVRTYDTFFLPETADAFDFTQYDYVVDAIDTVAGKLCLAERAQAAGVPILCSMGTGNKLDPTKLTVTDIYKTSVCPLARVMRYECRKRGIKKLKVLYSTETSLTPRADETPDNPTGRRSVPGSTAFVPPAAGLIIASEVVRELTGVGEK
jgi:tRNA A37 threonylcarbamoyladenosine dehydratase